MTGSIKKAPFPRGYADTSKAAHIDALMNRSKRVRAIMNCLTLSPEGLTGTEISRMAGMSVLSLRPAITELCQEGFLLDTGRRRKPEGSRMNEIIWVKQSIQLDLTEVEND